MTICNLPLEEHQTFCKEHPTVDLPQSFEVEITHDFGDKVRCKLLQLLVSRIGILDRMFTIEVPKTWIQETE